MSLIQKYVGQRWSQADRTPKRRHWWTSQVLSSHIDKRICPLHETGVSGLLREAIGERSLDHGVSIGAGDGTKEIRLLKSGLVEHFTLYELSAHRAQAARGAARAAGLEEKVTVRVADAFSEAPEPIYDFVYWDHALHHMMDVDYALLWSKKSLRPGGVLLINDYIGRTRLQWTRQEVDRARQFIAANQDFLPKEISTIKYKTIFHRWKQMLKDPSEAPQSDRIEESVRRHFGIDMDRIGGAMIHLCAGSVLEATGTDERHPLLERLIRFDMDALEDGHCHFASAIWIKPDHAV